MKSGEDDFDNWLLLVFRLTSVLPLVPPVQGEVGARLHALQALPASSPPALLPSLEPEIGIQSAGGLCRLGGILTGETLRFAQISMLSL